MTGIGAGATGIGAGAATGSDKPPADTIPAIIANGAASMLARTVLNVVFIFFSVLSG
jgi:hypothetical protein